VFDTFELLANRFIMPCKSDEEFAQGPEQPNSETPFRRRRKAGAGLMPKFWKKMTQMLKQTMIGASSRARDHE
jgi:hypothetical protein